MAISTYQTKLSIGEKDYAIKSFPSILGKRSALETTTMSDAAQTYIPGIKSMDSLSFTYNYDKTTFAAVKQDEGKPLHYALEFSDGSKFTWEGSHVATMAGAGVDAVVEAGISIAPSTEVVFNAGN